jgi:16S rRNA (guanine1207-N2)-methyltransferase
MRGTEDYYIWREFEGELAGEPIHWAGKPSLEHWDSIDPSVQLLARVLELGPCDRVLDLNCSAGWLGVLAARRTTEEILLASDHGLAVEATKRTLKLNGLNGRVQVIHGDALDRLEPQSFDAACLVIPKGKEVARRLVRLSAWALRPGGKLYIAGPKRGGIKSLIAYVKELFGGIELETYGGGCRAAMAVRPADLELEPPGDDFVLREAKARGRIWCFYTRPGMFAWEGLDEGTRLLLEVLELSPYDHVLDLGCGSGLIGAVTAHEADEGRIVLVDVSASALEAARRTLRLYKLPCERVEVRYSDIIDAVRDEKFDVVVTYPPVHQGWGTEREVALQFVRDAPKVLKSGGRLYVVSAAGLPYRRLLRELFGSVEVLADTGSHQVYRAVWSGSV